MCITIEDIIRKIKDEFQGTEIHNTWGETSFFYNPCKLLKRGTYFATIKEKDGENDRASNLDRPGIFRLNFGLPLPLYREMFGSQPKRPAKGDIIEGLWDFTELNKIIPHPVYGWMGWACVLNPTKETFKVCFPLLGKAYEKAKNTFEDRIRKEDQVLS